MLLSSARTSQLLKSEYCMKLGKLFGTDEKLCMCLQESHMFYAFTKCVKRLFESSFVWQRIEKTSDKHL